MTMMRKNSSPRALFSLGKLLMMAAVCLLLSTVSRAEATQPQTQSEIRTSEINRTHKQLQQEHPVVGQEQIVDKKIDAYKYNVRNFRAFEYGLDGDYFAGNFSRCSINTLTWWFFEVSTYKVKLRYANYDQAVTNTTLFIQNFTNMMIVCSDTIENLYFYGLNEAEKFGSAQDWGLGML
jgi:hypothetical protein